MLSSKVVLWYVNHTAGPISELTVWSALVWFYKCQMLLFALWLARSFFRWARFLCSGSRRGGTSQPRRGLRGTRLADRSRDPSASSRHTERSRSRSLD
jgi:hypothetical protein